MKEVLDRAIPQNFRDWVMIQIATIYLDSPGHRVGTPHARYWGHQMLMRWFRGEPTPLSQWAPRLLEGCQIKVTGQENLPDGGTIAVINQPNTGILHGNWFKFLFNDSAKKQRNLEAKWVQRADSNHPLIERIPLLAYQKRRLSRMIAQSCGTILINPTATSSRENLAAVLEMKRHLQNGGILVICPEGKDGQTLAQGKKEAGELILLLAKKTQALILPAGAWSEGSDLYLNFGETIDVGGLDKVTGQQMADLAMTKIATLLPEDRRGVYRTRVQSFLQV
jgi:hypothetical protein